jgi:hypothetical protein
MPEKLRSTLTDGLRAVIGSEKLQWTRSRDQGKDFTFGATHLTYYNRMSTDVCLPPLRALYLIEYGTTLGIRCANRCPSWLSREKKGEDRGGRGGD